MGENFSKKERQKKKAKAKQDKALRRQERKENTTKKSFEDMLAYIDENGNLSETPPDPTKKKEINAEVISLDISKQVMEANMERKGIVTFFNEAKGYGFITDTKTNESIFVHINQLSEPLKERDKVNFETERTQKGLSAINVKKIK